MRSLKAAFAMASLATLAGCGSEYDISEVNQKVRADFADSVFTEKESGDKINGTIITKRGDQVTEKVEVEDGVPNGEWVFYFDNGDVEQSLTVVKGNIVGVRTTYCDSNHKQPKSVSDYGPEVRTETDYHCGSGLVIRESRFDSKSNSDVGTQKEWHIVDGKQLPKSIENYNNEGKREGLEESYFKDGRMESSKTWMNGEMDGPFKEYVLYQDGTYRLKAEGIKKGYDTLEEKEYATDTKYPEGTLTHVRAQVAGGGYSDVYLRGLQVNSSFTPGNTPEGQNAQMIYKKVVSVEKPTAKDFENLQYLVETTKINLNDVYGNGYYVGLQGDRLITAASELYYDKLISMGVDPHGTNFDGTNRLQQCLKEARDCSFDHMLRLANDYIAADVKSKSLAGDTYAAGFCRVQGDIRDPRKFDLLGLLLKLDDINQVNTAGWTALHYCASQKDLTGAKMLLQAGADASVKNRDGFTPLQMAFIQPRGNQYSMRWSPEIVKAIGELAKGTTFKFTEPLPLFNKSLKDMFLQNGDIESTRLADSFN